jgi:hypothetical protein
MSHLSRGTEVIAVSTDSGPKETPHGQPDDLLDSIVVGDITLREMQPGWPTIPPDELARRQGVQPVHDIHAMAAPELFASDEEADEFVAWVRAERNAHLA